jgi:hypothetical protein
MKVEPSPGSLSAMIFPPWRSAINFDARGLVAAEFQSVTDQVLKEP